MAVRAPKEILRHCIVDSEVIVLASPVYCWSVSGCLSAALDRSYSLFKDDKSLIQNKKMIGVFTAGGNAFDGMDLCVDMLKRLCDYAGAKYIATLFAQNCTTPDELLHRKDLESAADDIVKSL